MPIIYAVIFIFALIGIDQWVKELVTVHLTLNQTIPLIHHVVSLTNLHNSGAAWSILTGQNWLFEIIAAVVLFILAYYLFKYRRHFIYTLSLSMIIAGTIGNLINRFIQGYVVDMFQLDFINFPVFNIADSCLTIGVLILIIAIIKE
ncbi:lipoprotein signal peptidase [Philodulcilactobacillus myokoensis]|uniref:Lipoprotein signal peptidase n=1 Tax=Philodulcilactobacillus myokoensis TaxID=2929573 RepID=A0A9W6ESZ8_9LACO|nr:signal peptidase II [Philodulcilactobacillus myokoensis]GLB46868.1 lipoprotein signal peptidase [Philodulcilactobacillus myokoensis]